MITLSQTPTNRVLVKAYTGSEWDSCNYAVITLPDREFIKSVMDAMRILPKDGLSRVKYYSSAVVFLNLDEDPLEAQQEWDFLDDAVTIMDFEFPKQDIRTEMLNISPYGSFDFNGYGKHTGEEFWTESISLQELYQNL